MVEPEVATRMAKVTCASPWAGTVTSAYRLVTISMESVSEDTRTRTGYGFAFVTVTGMLAVSLTTVTVSVGVMDTLFSNVVDKPVAASPIRWMTAALPDSASNPIRDCREFRHVIHEEGPFALFSATFEASCRASDCSSPLLDVLAVALAEGDDDGLEYRTCSLNWFRLLTLAVNVDNAASRRLRDAAVMPEL